MQQIAHRRRHLPIEFLPKVSEYLSLIMTLIFAFGICFQLPVVLTLLARAGHHRFAVPAAQAPLCDRHRLRRRRGADAAGRDQPVRASRSRRCFSTRPRIFSVRMVEKKRARSRGRARGGGAGAEAPARPTASRLAAVRARRSLSRRRQDAALSVTHRSDPMHDIDSSATTPRRSTRACEARAGAAVGASSSRSTTAPRAAIPTLQDAQERRNALSKEIGKAKAKGRGAGAGADGRGRRAQGDACQAGEDEAARARRGARRSALAVHAQPAARRRAGRHRRDRQRRDAPLRRRRATSTSRPRSMSSSARRSA